MTAIRTLAANVMAIIDRNFQLRRTNQTNTNRMANDINVRVISFSSSDCFSLAASYVKVRYMPSRNRGFNSSIFARNWRDNSISLASASTTMFM